ncbi:radical SAM protein, partial [Streptomyces anulatus]|uniref:radical SAM protein n=1 Tax=Streptomyces anulatus TaxID=1892 RepID=UPI003419C097
MDLRFLWLEITGKCPLTCVHCYADSSPAGTHGSMTAPDWMRMIDEAAEIGVRLVQFIGGEPTGHKALPALIGHALATGVKVEVYSNLVRVSDTMWKIFSQPGVQLATSFCTDDARQHMLITGRNTLSRTQNNIVAVLERRIPLRVGMVRVLDDQRL